MNTHQAVRFNEPPGTEYNDMDVDQSSVSRASLDDLYLGPDEEIDYDSLSSGGPDALAAMPDQSTLAHSDHPGMLIDPGLYLGPEDDVIDCDEEPELVDAHVDAPAAPEASMISHDKSADLPLKEPELPDASYEDLLSMVREFRPFTSYQYPEFESVQDRLRDYRERHGHLPELSIPQLIEAERPFRTAWAETSDKLRRAEADLRLLQRAQRGTAEMLKVVDSVIKQFEDQLDM